MSASVNEIDLLSQENGVSLNLDHLADLLCRNDVADQPIAVIGIVGPIRTGKSFLLSYLSRYLRSQGWLDSDDWMGDDQTSLRDGFSWQGGKDPHTQGVKASNEIFRVVDKNGKQLNVLLIDTQGLFGSSMTKDDDGKLFTLSGALCSTLIFNVERKIDERQLESLEFFTQYATATYSHNDHQEARTVQPLQNLMFLVRDWAYAYEHDFGARGGKSYVDECLLMTKNNCAEGNSVRQNLKSVIKRIDGFLLPHPGPNTEQIDFSGTNEEVSGEFLESVAEFARTVFNPENLEPRMFGGEPMTGRRLLLLMKACDKTLNGTIPEVLNSFSVFSKLTASTAAEDAFKEFQLGVEQVAKSGGNPDGIYETKLKECLQRYVSDTFVCGNAVQDEYMDRLTLKCQECFVNTFNWSDFQKRQAYNASIQAVNGAWADYKQIMKDAMGLNAKSEKTLTEMHEKYQRVASKDYKDEVTSRAAFDVDHYRLLQDLINKSWSKFKEINGRRERPTLLAELENSTHEYEAQLFLNELIEHFREEMEKFSHLYMNEKEMLQQVENLQSEFIDLFNDQWMYEWPEIHPYRQALMEVLRSERDDCMHCNSRNKDALLSIMEESVLKAKAIYHDSMSKAIRNGCYESKALKSAHEQARQFVMSKLRDELKEIESSLSESKFRQLEAHTDTEYQKFCKLNECNDAPTKKAPASANNNPNIKDFLMEAYSATNTVASRINRMKTNVRLIKSAARSSVTPLTMIAGSLGRTTTLAFPYVLIGVAAAGAVAVGYYVYRRYQKNNDKDKQLMIAQ